jgi:hypothetical protein
MATGMSDHIAKPDYAAVHLALARWRLEHPGEDPPPDEPIALFDDDQGLDDARGRHPAGGDAA